MEALQSAKVVTLRSHHDKFLFADEDGETVTQDRDGNSANARWTIEFVTHADRETLRFKSCYGKYLTASNQPFRGYKVLQTSPKLRLESSMEWEPIRDGLEVRLVTAYGQFMCANGGVPPWRNSITHDARDKVARQDWILWGVYVLKKRAADNEEEEGDQETDEDFMPITPKTKKREKIRQEVKANVIKFSDKMKKVGLKMNRSQRRTNGDVCVITQNGNE